MTTVKQHIRQRVFVRDGYECIVCGADEDLTVDHIVPRARGGGNYQANLCCLCSVCNTKKADLSLSEFIVVLLLEGMTKAEADRIRRAVREAQLRSTPGFEEGMVDL